MQQCPCTSAVTPPQPKPLVDCNKSVAGEGGGGGAVQTFGSCLTAPHHWVRPYARLNIVQQYACWAVERMIPTVIDPRSNEGAGMKSGC